MALRLRRDVQKASYYVWFLGAEEARGLRGPRVINPVVPYLVERAREQEPLKVTLQVSHKGIKILQGSSKHFIPHSAITSSVQTEDIVACVLLLYNPATKCPLHVHAYRCDSETTAEALHQQLQVLINRPENQKRFAELESRLGITAPLQQPMNHVPEPKRVQRRAETSPKRFESSLGSDTGTSTRESECSEEHLPLSPLPKAKVNLFDSLAAELRAKLNGNGPPLLLPPRDYDTVHRSKGNLAAIELRRCRNSLIVGQTNQTTTTTSSSLLSQKQGVSSRGSSGIGSDLAPSPERQDGHSSSEDENWSNEAENSIIALQAPQSRRSSETRYRPSVEMSEKPKHPSPRDKYAYHRSLSREKEPPARHSWSREDEIRPIIMRPSDFDARFKKVMLERDPEDVAEFEAHRRASYMNGRDHYPASQDRKYRKHSDEKKPEKLEKSFQHKMILDKQQQQQPRYDYDDDFDSEEEEIPIRGENLTDRQKYQEAYIKKEKVVIEGSRHPNRHRPQMYYASPDRERSHHVDSYPPHYSERNAYRESPQKNHKSPVIRYKSFDDSDYTVDNEASHPSHRYNRSADKYAMNSSSPERYDHMERQYSSSSSRRQAKSSSPESSIKVSPKDRFYDAKEKFRALETNNKIPPYPEIHRRGSLDPADIIDTRYENWSDDEQRTSQHGQRKDRRHLDQVKRDHYHRNDPQYPPMVIHNSKSLSNIAKGYRHSYAEPRAPLPRGAPRVGLAAVNPF